MMMAGSSKTVDADGVPDKFPAGLRVLVVDENPISLKILEKMLKECNYLVTTCNKPLIGLALLKENKNGYDIVMVDVHKPHMDGFRLLGHIRLEMDIPVIMISGDDCQDVEMQSVTQGACDFLVKPIGIEILRNIWQHVVRSKKHERKDFKLLTSVDDVDQHQNVTEDADYTSSEDGGHVLKYSKKPQIVWTLDNHKRFVSVVNQLGIDEAEPSKILELMNDVPGMSIENVASHLQKFRLYLERLGPVRIDKIY